MGATTALMLLAFGLIAIGLVIDWLGVGITGTILGATGLAGAVGEWGTALVVLGILLLIVSVALVWLGHE